MQRIPFKRFNTDIFQLWEDRWLLLTSGDFESGRYNTMTVAWGSFGIMWNKPVAIVVVRPVRYTFKFMEKYETFTLCAFPETYRKDLSLLGTKSGRDGNKIAETGLSVCASQKIASPSFEQAELSVECTKIYWDDYKPQHFLHTGIEKNYPRKDYHRIYYGEILGIMGTDQYITK